MTESSAKPVVASGSKSSTMEVNTAAPAAATVDQELLGTSMATADVGKEVAVHPLSPHSAEELAEGSYPPGESVHEEMVLDSPQVAAPDVSAPSSFTEAMACEPAGTTGQKRKTEAGTMPPQVTKRRRSPNGALLLAWLLLSRLKKKTCLGLCSFKATLTKFLRRTKLLGFILHLATRSMQSLSWVSRLFPYSPNLEYTVAASVCPVPMESPSAGLPVFWALWRDRMCRVHTKIHEPRFR